MEIFIMIVLGLGALAVYGSIEEKKIKDSRVDIQDTMEKDVQKMLTQLTNVCASLVKIYPKENESIMHCYDVKEFFSTCLGNQLAAQRYENKIMIFIGEVALVDMYEEDDVKVPCVVLTNQKSDNSGNTHLRSGEEKIEAYFTHDRNGNAINKELYDIKSGDYVVVMGTVCGVDTEYNTVAINQALLVAIEFNITKSAQNIVNQVERK